MAQNLIKNGHSLVVYDIYPEAMAPLEALGAVAVRSPADVADNSDQIITMLPSSPQVLQAYTGDGGIFKYVTCSDRNASLEDRHSIFVGISGSWILGAPLTLASPVT